MWLVSLNNFSLISNIYCICLSLCLSVFPSISLLFSFLPLMIKSEVQLQSIFAAVIKTWLEYRARPPPTNTHTCMDPQSPLQWRALINSQGVHVVEASGVIKSPSEPSQERVRYGGGQRGADVGLAYSSPQGSSLLDLPIDLPPLPSFSYSLSHQWLYHWPPFRCIISRDQSM